MTAPFINLPSKPDVKGASGTGSQRDRRFTDTYFDIHKSARFPRGRPFCGEREQAATPDQNHLPGFISPDLQCGEFVCENPIMGQTIEERRLSLASAWSAPWLPLAKYWKFHHQRKLITFKYETMESDETAGLALFWEAAAKMAGENDVVDPERPLALPYRMRVLMGSPLVIMGKIRIAQAAKAGDPWLLGHIDEPNEELAKILGFKVLFRGEGAERGGLAMAAVRTEPQPPEPILTPAQVLATPMEELMKMVAEVAAKAAASAVEAGFSAREKQAAEKKKADRDRMAKVRAARKTNEAA